jgi:hypothetical protein
MTAFAASLALSGCAGSLPSAGGPATGTDPAAANASQRDLTPPEKKAIIDTVALSLRAPASAKYRWTKFPAAAPDGAINYCATVDAGSPFAAYNGHQAYIVELKVVGGKVVAATMGLIVGGKDLPLVAKMCAKYGLDPNKAI